MKISYELARKLKEAGLPQEGKVQHCIPCEAHHDTIDYDCQDCGWVAFPTLSELIEACGDEFWDLIKSRMRTEKIWKADAYKLGGEISTFGDTPEEAVARLWLALNKK